jgi:hypothetical protein
MGVVQKKSFFKGRWITSSARWKEALRWAKKGQGLVLGHFYTTLNLEVGKEWVITWILWPMGWGEDSMSQEWREQSQTFPKPNLPQLPPEGPYSKKFFLGDCWSGGQSIFSICFKLTRGCRPYLSGILSPSYCYLWALNQWHPLS